ncbi:hypothetical protein ASD24_28670 [Paenibacillus sp. Root52]|uniref:hypothetical protein n=1 Tax=Paenibacillus sp. Root52 TaxID=1736552 RepID=UPI000700512F|nr:hypothetical protein [Paenibacillus sp. Root52]KQY85258.1 hypothetical protein ASD24_28670 [Paenibacillus sp. Root52]
MEKLVMYKDKFFFLQSINFDKYDMEFAIYNLANEQIGSTFFGFNEGANPFDNEVETDEFMEWVQDESHKIEAEFKFLFEFFHPVEAADELGFSAPELAIMMQEKWNISYEIMDAILP